MKKHPISFYLSIIFMPLAALLIDTLLPFFLSLSIGSISTSDHESLVRNLVLAGVVGLLGIGANFIGFQALLRQTARVRTDIYNNVFDALTKKDHGFFVNTKVGALTSRFLDFVRAQGALQDLLIIRTLGFILSVSIGLIIVTFNAPWLALVLIGLFALIVIEIKIFTKIRNPLRHQRKEAISELHGDIADSLTNNLIVKTFANEKKETAQIVKQTSRLENIFIKDIGLFGLDGTIRTTIMTTTQIIGISICAFLVFHGQMPLALAIFALAYLQRISSQIFALGEILNGYDDNLIQASAMTEILAQPNIIKDMPRAKTLRNISPTVDFQRVSYSYDKENENAIDNMELHIAVGQKLGVVGHSGAGKTTITQLLLRFADVTEGTIKIGGFDIREVTQESLRKNIGYVSQEPMLFHRTLRENIAYGHTTATDDEIEAAARKANALEFIQKLPHGLDTLVGERGVKLSGGQRQRIAIARAILKDAPILVLDEATSALDSESEKLIQDALQKLMQGRTSIVIAHRLSTIAKLDRIIVLDQGKIIEDGTHDSLLKQNGTYAKLWAHQSGGFIEE